MEATGLFRAMAWNNAWANHRLLTACEALDDGAFAAPRPGFFPGLRATLNHLHVVDLFYVDALEGGTLGPAAWAEPEPHATAAALRAAQAAVDRRLVALVEAMGADGLSATVSVRRERHVQRERADRLLLHLFQHQIHHRGQAHAMLSHAGAAPPQLDEFFCAEDAPLRAADFAALGLTEARARGGDAG
jgi:uncharacterized damage-inducible protein DinB